MHSAEHADKDTIRGDPNIQQLLARMPDAVNNSFSDEQLVHLKTAIGGRSWGKHAVDFRGTCNLPFTHWRYYYVILLGRNRRHLSDKERRISALITSLFIIGFFFFCAVVGLLVLYLLKSFSGIDLFPGFSFGIWDHFKTNFM